MENLGTRVASVTNTSWQLLHLHKQTQPQLLIRGYSQLAQQHTFLITSIHLRGKYVESYTRMKEKFGDLKGCKSQKDRLYNGQIKKDKQWSSSNICSTRCTCRVPVKQQTSCDMEIMLDTSIQYINKYKTWFHAN